MSYSDCNRMPGIIAVKYIKAPQLARHILEKYVAGVPVAIGALGTPLQLVDDGNADCIRAYEHNGLASRATLEFKTLDDVPTDEDIVWAAQDATKQWWLIGTRERNFPVVETSRSAGTPGGDPAVTTVKVTHTAKIAIIPVAE